MKSSSIKKSSALSLLALGCAMTLPARNLPVPSTDDHQVVVTAVIDDLPNGAYVHFFSYGDNKHDSVLVRNHGFTFKKEIVKGDLYMIWWGINPSDDDMHKALLFLQPGTVNITGKGPFFRHAVITGLQCEMDWEDYNSNMLDSAMIIEEDALTQKESAAITSGSPISKADRDRLAEIRQQHKDYSENWVKAHPNSPVSAYAIQMYIMPHGSALEGYLDNLTPEARDNYFFDRLEAKAKLAKSPVELGKAAPDFVQNDINGTPVSLSGFKGKYVLVDFWASWCKPCRAENPNVKAAYDHFKDKNFTVLSVSMDEDKGKWTRAVAEDQLPWTQVSDLLGNKNAAALLYRVSAIPASFLIGPDGALIAYGLRGDALEKKLEELLK